MSKHKIEIQEEKRRQRNMTPQKTNNHTVEDLEDSEGEEFPVA
jgi:hypothetical protein